MTYSNRQLIAREIEMEKVRKFQSSISDKSQPSAQKVVKKTAAAVTSPDNASLPNHLQTLKAKSVKVNTPVSVFLFV